MKADRTPAGAEAEVSGRRDWRNCPRDGKKRATLHAEGWPHSPVSGLLQLARTSRFRARGQHRCGLVDLAGGAIQIRA